MILDDAIADDLRALGFETTSEVEADPVDISFGVHQVDFHSENLRPYLLRLRYEFDLGQRTCRIGNLSVHPDLRSRTSGGTVGGIGRCVTRRFAKEALHHGLKEIVLGCVQYDGLSYWPSLGARPATLNKGRFHRALFNVLAAREQFPRSDLALAARTIDVIGDKADLKAAWKLIAKKEKDGGPSTPCLAQITTQTLFNDTDMVLDLTDADVLARLGLTPP